MGRDEWEMGRWLPESVEGISASASASASASTFWLGLLWRGVGSVRVLC